MSSSKKQQAEFLLRQERFSNRRKAIAKMREDRKIGALKAVLMSVAAWFRIIIAGKTAARKPRPWYAYISLWILVVIGTVVAASYYRWWSLVIPIGMVALAILHWTVRRRKGRKSASSSPAPVSNPSSANGRSWGANVSLALALVSTVAIVAFIVSIFVDSSWIDWVWRVTGVIALVGWVALGAWKLIASSRVAKSKSPRAARNKSNSTSKSFGWKTLAAASFAFLALGAIVAGAIVGANTGAPVTTVQGISQEQHDKDVQEAAEKARKKADEEYQKKLTPLEERIKKLEGEQKSEPEVRQVSTHLTEQQQKIADPYAAAGGDVTNLRFNDIDYELARQVDAGGSVFGDPIYTSADAVKFMTSGTPEAKAAVAVWAAKNKRCQPADMRDAKQWTAVQFMESIRFNGNTLFADNSARDSGSKVDPAGSVALYFTGECADTTDGPFGIRGACANPQLKFVAPASVPQGNGSFIPASYTPDNPRGNGCVRPNDCKPVKPPKKDCTTNPEMPECKPKPPEDCKTNPEKPECKPKPPEDCKTNPEKPECKPKPPEDCKTNPEKPECKPKPPVKCENAGPDKICGTPDDGGEQQPVGDNGGLADPTEGYEPGSAEEVIDQQHSETPGGLDPTEHGTPADPGQSPGGHVDVPVPGTDGSGGNNPGADGTPPSTNPDVGTTNPEDSSTVGETTDPGAETPGFNLPAFAPETAAPAAPEATYSAPAAEAPAADASATDTGSFGSDGGSFDAVDTGDFGGGMSDVGGDSDVDASGSSVDTDTSSADNTA